MAKRRLSPFYVLLENDRWRSARKKGFRTRLDADRFARHYEQRLGDEGSASVYGLDSMKTYGYIRLPTFTTRGTARGARELRGMRVRLRIR